MKKFIVFIASFIVLYFGFQLISGWILTSLYTPSPSLAASTQTVSFGEASTWSFIFILIAASIAFLFSNKVVKTQKG